MQCRIRFLIARGRSRGGAVVLVRVDHATVFKVVRSRVDTRRFGGVDTKSHPTKQTIGDAVAQQGVLEHGIDAVGLGLALQDIVVLVGGDGLPIGVVRLEGLDGVDEVLVKEGLTDVARPDGVADGVVGEDGRVGRVDEDVDVIGAREVVAGEDGLELRDAVLVRLLDTAEPGRVDIVGVGLVAVAAGHDARVYACGIAVPHFHVDVGDGLARVDVDDLVVEDCVDSGLFLDDVLADVFTTDVCFMC